MFGMPSTEFWEEEPQLYWAYLFSYQKKIEYENKRQEETLKLSAWLNGKTEEIAVSIALNNGFSKQKLTYPSYEELFEKQEINTIQQDIKNLQDNTEDKNEKVNIEFNYWARM